MSVRSRVGERDGWGSGGWTKQYFHHFVYVIYLHVHQTDFEFFIQLAGGT